MTRAVAAALSMLVPGLGQLYVGRDRRAAVLLCVSAALALAAVGVAAWRPGSLDLRLLVAVLAADALVALLRVGAVVDAWRVAPGRGAVAALAALVALTAAPHVAAGYVATRGYVTLDRVFANEEPNDVLASRGVFLTHFRKPKPKPLPTAPVQASPLVVYGEPPADRAWTTILLIGTDEGPGNWGARTDTMILVALQHGTHRAAAFGIPRNFVDVPVAVRGLERYHEPLNGLYGFARTKPELFPGARDPGATALKQSVSLLLGVRVDYYALANLRGFADLVDALGGVTIRVKERLVDSVTRPAWGEPKPRIDVHPGRTYHFGGRTALAYVRSRKASNDYTRMARQRCFLSAMADQLDPLTVLRSFDSLAKTVERNVRTDVPLDGLPNLVRLVAAVDSRKTLTVTFGPEYIFGRRKRDAFPAPNGSRIRGTVRDVLLNPVRAEETGRAASTQKTC